jgi:hypothetical protein
LVFVFLTPVPVLSFILELLCFAPLRISPIPVKTSNQPQEEIGFGFEARVTTHKWENVRLALLTFKNLNGHLQVPSKFKVPDDDPRWPEQTRGIHLGTLTSHIRLDGSYAKHHEELRTMGFNFNKFRVRRK